MSEAVLAGLDPAKVAEMSLIDLTFLILKTTDKPYHYRDLMNEVARMKGLSEEYVNEVIARLYTEINIDGRFVCIGGNVWGLKRWYPTDKTADKTAGGGKKFVRKDMDDDDDFYDEDEDDSFEDEIDEVEPFGAYGTDDDDVVEEEDELEGFTAEGDEDEEEPVEEEGTEENEEDEFDSYEDEDEF